MAIMLIVTKLLEFSVLLVSFKLNLSVNGQNSPYEYTPYQQQIKYEQYNQFNSDENRAFDREYKTYIYKGRRYGQEPNSRGWRPGDPRLGQDERLFYDRIGHEEPILPGVLGGWRSNIQGKPREQTKNKLKDIFVKTTHGEVQGFSVILFDNPDPDSLYRPGSEFIEREYGTTSVFLGIPFAEPPIREGRFMPPRWHKGWQLLQAVDFGPACPQPNMYTTGIRDIDEDCLYLNIYTPPLQEGVGQKYPVMFYIHGGDFIHGASNNFPGHILATFYKVVVVTINYRLGALGFLSTGDINSPGNYGILDQSMALRWIYENAEYFNGDKDRITLFGPGAGAASAGLLMVYPGTKQMVSNVIAQSGSAVADWAMIFDKYRAQNTSRVFGKLAGCTIDSSWKLVNCLKGRSFLEIGNTVFTPEIGLFPWAPVIEMNVTAPYYEGWNERDWHFIKDSAETLIKKGAFNRKLRYMSSVTLQEAANFITSNSSLKPQFIVNQEFFDQKIHELVLTYNYTLNQNGTYEAIKYMYTFWPNPENVTHIRNKYIQLLSDFLYTAPNDKIVKLLVEKNVPVYMYVLNTTIESFKYPEWRKVPHDIEHYLLCGAPFMDVEFFPGEQFVRNQWTNNDRNMSHFFMKAYSNFAWFGNPTHTQILGLNFEVAEFGQLKYLNINTTYNSTIKWNFRQTESAFWTQYLPTVVGHMIATYPPTTEFWWEPTTPLQIAFWSMSAACLLLIVLLVMCCMLWRNAKRQADRYYNTMLMVHETDDPGIENMRVTDYDYSEKLRVPSQIPMRTNSASSFPTDVSSKELQSFVSISPNSDQPTKDTPVLASKKTKSQFAHDVPQTDV